jgi:hypothetical protein
MSQVGGLRTPQKKVLEVTIPATAAGSDADFIVGKAPLTGVVDSVEFIPVSTITGANTNTRKHTVNNRGSAGLGTTKIAELQYNSGVNATAFDAKALTNEVAASLAVTKDDVLSFTSLHVGTGLADPGGKLIVTFSRPVAATS